MDDAGSKRDGGDVSFPSGAQAQNKPERAGRQIGLVKVWNDGWIEEGCGFQGVFRQEIGPDQQSSFLGKVLIRRQGLAHLFEAFQEDFVYLLVPLAEFSADFVE